MPQTYDYWDGQSPNMFQQNSQQAVDDLNERFERLQQAMSVGAMPPQDSQPSASDSQFMSQISQASEAGLAGTNAAGFTGANAAGIPVYEVGSNPEPMPQPSSQPEPAPQPSSQPEPTPQPASESASSPAAVAQDALASQQPQQQQQPQPQPQQQQPQQQSQQLLSQPQQQQLQQSQPQQPVAQSAPASQQQSVAQPAPAARQARQQPQHAYAAAAQQPAYAAAGQAPTQQPTQQPMPQQVIYQMPPQKKSRGWIVALVLVIGLLALAFFGVKSCSDAIVSSSHYSIGTGPTTDSVAVLTMDGTIQYDGTACSPEGFKSLLDEAAKDSHIKALVLRVNSGGGVAAAGEEMAAYLRDFSKPVVVSSASINASAAYEISSQGDWIMVLKSTEIGSIGTAMELTDISGLLDMLGIQMEVITSADSKDSSYGYRQLSDEERGYYQHMVAQINELFIQNVADGRKMDIEKVRELANGLAYTGVDAIENGLADEYGTMDDAISKAAALAGLSSYDVYELSLTTYDWASLYDILGRQGGDQQKLIPLLTGLLGQKSK